LGGGLTLIRRHGARLKAMKAGSKRQAMITGDRSYCGGRDAFVDHLAQLEDLWSWALRPFLAALSDLMTAAGNEQAARVLGAAPLPAPLPAPPPPSAPGPSAPLQLALDDAPAVPDNPAPGGPQA
jgi:hypothetical protein